MVVKDFDKEEEEEEDVTGLKKWNSTQTTSAVSRAEEIFSHRTVAIKRH